MRIALDTNILAYAEGVNGVEARDRAKAALHDFGLEGAHLPAQTLLELYNVLVRRGGRSAAAARSAVAEWASALVIIDTDAEVVDGAMELAGRHRIGWWDAVVLASAARAHCRLLLSEDMQDGFAWRGVTVRNPFAA